MILSGLVSSLINGHDIEWNNIPFNDILLTYEKDEGDAFAGDRK